MDLKCLNCKEGVASDDVKLFAEVFLCTRCYYVAERLYLQGERELRMMLLVLKEAIRIAALKGELQFSVQYIEDMPKADLLSHLAKLAENTKKQATPMVDACPTSPDKLTPSLVTTSPLALPVGGKPSTG